MRRKKKAPYEPVEPKPECEYCGSKFRCIHRQVPVYQLRAPDLFGEVLILENP
jgi:hypothetical protein